MSENHKVLFTDPTDPAWTLIEFAGKPLIFHECSDHTTTTTGFHPIVEHSEDACGYCTQEPPPGFIALYKLYTWDNND